MNRCPFYERQLELQFCSSVCDMSTLRSWTRGQHLLMPTREQTPLLKYEKHAQKKSVGGGLKPVADDHEQHYNRTNSATFQRTSRSAVH